jgi:hypothetical protein
MRGCCARAASGHATETVIALMKLRRRIACLRARIASRLSVTEMRLQQGFANDEMGFALQKSSSAHVSYGSIADNVDNPNRVVRYEARFRAIPRSRKSRGRMSALGQKQTHASQQIILIGRLGLAIPFGPEPHCRGYQEFREV